MPPGAEPSGSAPQRKRKHPFFVYIASPLFISPISSSLSVSLGLKKNIILNDIIKGMIFVIYNLNNPI